MEYFYIITFRAILPDGAIRDVSDRGLIIVADGEETEQDTFERIMGKACALYEIGPARTLVQYYSAQLNHRGAEW